MSSRKLSSSGDDMSSTRRGERTPLRCLENEILHLSTPSSRFKPKSLLNADGVKMTKDDVPLCDLEAHSPSPPSTNVTQTSGFGIDTPNPETACGLGNVTFKSFLCPGGEVEITDSSLCGEESIILPKDQAMGNTDETEDTFDSIIAQSCGDHIEHPYHNPEMKDSSLVETAGLCEVSNTTLASGGLDDKRVTQDSTAHKHEVCEQNDVTWKSFACDGGEVEVSDVIGLQDETIPLPKEQLDIPPHESGVNSTHLSNCGQLHQDEHSEHPYCSRENVVAVISSSSQTTNGSEQAAVGLSDVIFESFNCTGGEIQISDDITLADETVPLPADQTAVCNELYDDGIDPSMSAIDQDVQNAEKFDHPYCHIESYQSTPNDKLSITQEPSVRLDAVDEGEQIPDSLTDRRDGGTFSSFIIARSEVEESDDTRLSLKTLPDDQAMIRHLLCGNIEHASVTQVHIQDDDKQTIRRVENKDVVVDTDPPAVIASSQTNTLALDEKSVNSQVRETPKEDSIQQDTAFPSVHHQIKSSDLIHLAASAETSTPVQPDHVSKVHLSREANDSNEATDSGLCSSKNGPAVSGTEMQRFPEMLPAVLKVLSECRPVASALQSGLLSPIVRRASLFLLGANKDPAVDQFLAEDSALECEKSLLAPVNVNSTELWVEHLENPMPRPLFNSTALVCKAQPGPGSEPVEDVDVKPCAVPQPDVEKPVLDIPFIPEGPLQQQLRQMAEFLFLASGKMDPAAVSAPIPPPPAVVSGPSAKASPVESHSICVGTTPMKGVDHGINTSGQFERKRNFSVLDSCTLTDPLLWNIPPGSLERLPREELEQRLRSSMIMVEALVQQLATARTRGCSTGPAPSDLREKLVQTDHTELAQTTMHRDLYFEALRRIGELELDGNSLQTLIQCMQDMRATMTSLSCGTNAVLSNMKQIGDVVSKDHQSLVSHYGQMKSLFEKMKETQTAMRQKVKDALQQRCDSRIQMEEAFTAKEAAFNAVEQLRTHCATEISELERIVGSQQELSAALDQTYPELVALNQASAEMLNSASDLLSTTTEEQSSLMEELCEVRSLVQKAAPMLVRLNERAAAALRERDEQISAREQAVDERDQAEQELHHTNLNLQTAREQIGDLNLEVTILTSEMGVLRQKLTERDEERGQLERQVTELSATISSTLASYAFLENALAAETTKLQQSWKDIQLAKDRANELETSLGQSEQRVSELSQALTQREEQLGHLQELSKFQNMEIQQLQDVCTQLRGVQEMNEFLQTENDLAREQMAESECMLSANLKGLRERNIQCEDLKRELGQLQLENKSLQEELETTRSRAKATQLELGEKLAQAVTEITLLHHTLRGLTNELHEALKDQRPEPQKDKESQAAHNGERRHPSSSFVDSVIVAFTAEKEEDAMTDTSPEPAVSTDPPEPHRETLFSETSAFTRIAPFTPKKTLKAAEAEPEEDDQCSMSKLFAGLDSTVTELISTLKLVGQQKDARLEELHNIICGLQVEQQAANNRHQAEVFELQHQLSRLNGLAERGSQALQQKAWDEKTLTKLMSDVQETQEILTKHKAESNDLRKEVTELRRSLQQSKAESRILRGELTRADGQSASAETFMEEKIQLLKEVERLKLSLQEVEEARVKLRERAKRHQIVHQTNQQKSENELQLLNNVVNKVRETLLSLPNVVKDSEELQQLVEYIG